MDQLGSIQLLLSCGVEHPQDWNDPQAKNVMLTTRPIPGKRGIANLVP